MPPLLILVLNSYCTHRSSIFGGLDMIISTRLKWIAFFCACVCVCLSVDGILYSESTDKGLEATRPSIEDETRTNPSPWVIFFENEIYFLFFFTLKNPSGREMKWLHPDNITLDLLNLIKNQRHRVRLTFLSLSPHQNPTWKPLLSPCSFSLSLSFVIYACVCCV
jgi:hypothetical protein